MRGQIPIIFIEQFHPGEVRRPIVKEDDLLLAAGNIAADLDRN